MAEIISMVGIISVAVHMPYSTQAELVTLHYLQSFSVVGMCKNNIFASTFIIYI